MQVSGRHGVAAGALGPRAPRCSGRQDLEGVIGVADAERGGLPRNFNAQTPNHSRLCQLPQPS
jgi:hypothetical protein